jgi:hypothetical protein
VPGPEGFDYEVRGAEVVVTHRGRRAAVLRGDVAARFLDEVGAGDDAGGQELMARVTGNYRRGNERTARNHPRNARR